MSIKSFTIDKAYQLQSKLAGEAQLRFINQVMEWESVDYETAYAICTGHTDPKEPEYTLGFKMSDPLYQMAMNMQGKKKRLQAINNFEKLLDADELQLFRDQVLTMDTKSMMKAALKKRKSK